MCIRDSSTAGAVDEMYDLLVEFENYIVGETVIPIRHTLSGLPGASLKDVKTVYSKGVALSLIHICIGQGN